MGDDPAGARVVTYRIQTLYRGEWRNAWRNIVGLARALEMQQELEYGGIAARIVR